MIKIEEVQFFTWGSDKLRSRESSARKLCMSGECLEIPSVLKTLPRVNKYSFLELTMCGNKPTNNQTNHHQLIVMEKNGVGEGRLTTNTQNTITMPVPHPHQAQQEVIWLQHSSFLFKEDSDKV